MAELVRGINQIIVLSARHNCFGAVKKTGDEVKDLRSKLYLRMDSCLIITSYVLTNYGLVNRTMKTLTSIVWQLSNDFYKFCPTYYYSFLKTIVKTGHAYSKITVVA